MKFTSFDYKKNRVFGFSKLNENVVVVQCII